jgi:hypothetical protein
MSVTPPARSRSSFSADDLIASPSARVHRSEKGPMRKENELPVQSSVFLVPAVPDADEDDSVTFDPAAVAATVQLLCDGDGDEDHLIHQGTGTGGTATAVGQQPPVQPITSPLSSSNSKSRPSIARIAKGNILDKISM